MKTSETIIAVNTDPEAAIFDVAHYGAVADLFDVAEELEKLLRDADPPDVRRSLALGDRLLVRA